ncbi:hypothetical protein IL306_014176 [Fusarium sp. DS 682]|nr:hypothetical protein IL306_014176 [Fusarium sp. DS 682]
MKTNCLPSGVTHGLGSDSDESEFADRFNDHEYFHTRRDLGVIKADPNFYRDNYRIASRIREAVLMYQQSDVRALEADLPRYIVD